MRLDLGAREVLASAWISRWSGVSSKSTSAKASAFAEKEVLGGRQLAPDLAENGLG